MKRSASLVSVLMAGCATAGSPAAVVGDAPAAVDAPSSRIDAPSNAIDAPANAIDAPANAIDAPAGTGTHLVINEVDYDQIGTDTSELVEIYNPTGASVSLSHIALMLVNGASSPAVVYTTVDLSQGATSLAAGGYLVICNLSVNVAAGASRFNPNPAWNSNAIQNGPSDGLALVDTSSATLIDALSYDGAITAATLPGFTGDVSLVEGTAATAIDSSTVTGSLCRSPNGADTDDADADWKFCTTLTAGAANQL